MAIVAGLTLSIAIAQGDRCRKDKKQTILGDSLGMQGGRRASHDSYALVSYANGSHMLKNGRGSGKHRQRGSENIAVKKFHELTERTGKYEGMRLNHKFVAFDKFWLNPH